MPSALLVAFVTPVISVVTEYTVAPCACQALFTCPFSGLPRHSPRCYLLRSSPRNGLDKLSRPMLRKKRKSRCPDSSSTSLSHLLPGRWCRVSGPSRRRQSLLRRLPHRLSTGPIPLLAWLPLQLLWQRFLHQRAGVSPYGGPCPGDFSQRRPALHPRQPPQ